MLFITILALHIINFWRCRNYWWGGGGKTICFPPPQYFHGGRGAAPPPRPPRIDASAWNCTVLCTVLHKTNTGATCNEYLTGDRGQRLAGQSHCENFPFAILVAVLLTGCNLRGSPAIYLNLGFFIFLQFLGRFFSNQLLSPLKMIHFIKSDNEFLSAYIITLTLCRDITVHVVSDKMLSRGGTFEPNGYIELYSLEGVIGVKAKRELSKAVLDFTKKHLNITDANKYGRFWLISLTFSGV